LLLTPTIGQAADDQAKIDASIEAAQAARAHYRGGRYIEAAEGYARAYELFPQLSYLEKIARSYGKDPSLCREGEAAWRRFLRVCDGCDRQAEALRKVEEISAACAKNAQALSADAPAAARERYRAGLAHAKAGAFAKAVNSYRVALDLWPSSAIITLALARALEQTSDLAAAADAYANVLKLAPELKDRAAIETIIASLRKQAADKRARITVKTTPHGAKIFVDGSKGPLDETAPTKFRLGAGQHVLSLRLRGYYDDEVALLVENEKTYDVVRTLRAIPPPPPDRTLSWTTGGLGVAAIAAGLGFHFSAMNAADEISRTDLAAYGRNADAIESNERLAFISYGVGVALITTAVLLWPKAKAVPAISTQGGASTMGWSF
jgi:tetratricopeptide (TPR) repeat protein